MDSQDEARSTTQGRPATSLSNDTAHGSLSTLAAESSSHPHEGDASVTGSDRLRSAQSEPKISYRDLAPRETSACARLIDQIRASSIKRNADTSSTEQAARTTGPLLTEAALTIQYNAKWFPETQLIILLNVALDAVATSNSSAELLAMVRLVETTSTYAYIPHSCLRQIIRFLAQTYHGATRAVKTKKLATTVWETLEKLLASHLGNQCIAILLEILEHAHEDLLQKQQGYAQVSGALHLMMERFDVKDSSLPSASVLDMITALRELSSQGSPTLCESIMEATCQILEVPDAVETLDEVLGWNLVMDIVESCMEQSPDCSEAKTMFDIVIRHLDHFEERHLHSVALLAARLSCEIPSQLAREMSSIADILDSADEATMAIRLDEKLKVLSRSLLNLDHLDAFLKNELPALLELTGPSFVSRLVVMFENIAKDSETPPGAVDVIADFCASLLEQSVDNKGDILCTMFELCCTLSAQSLPAAKAILKIRADTEQALFLIGASNEGPFASLQDFPPLPRLDKALLRIIKEKQDWRVYDYVTAQLTLFLSNHALFETRVDFIRKLRAVICEQLKTGDYPDPPEESGRTRSQIARNLIQALTAIVSYHNHLNKQDLVTMISIFVDVSGIRDYGVSIDCIHALSVCCYEIPVTMTRFIDDVIDKMAKLVTQKALAIHVLLFLAGLSRLPGLFRNFHESNFKKIFGVCGNYLQSIRGTDAFERRPVSGDDRNNAATVDAIDEMPQYVYALAHHVICFWYIATRASERKDLKQYITSCLRYQTSDGHEKIEDQGLVTIDLMDAIDAKEDQDSDGVDFPDFNNQIDALHRISGSILISTYPQIPESTCMTVIRRPSGNSKRLISQKSASEIALSMESPYSTLDPSETISLDRSPELDRAIQSLDRVSGLDSHKAGIVYVGEGQSDEFEILQNSSGSPDFCEFINLLGQPRRLRGATFNTQGLDRHDDSDGTSTIVWENDLTQLVYHITTLMPKDPESVVHKKKHIGNDAVNIVFNNAGRPFLFDTLPTQVTHAYIVVSPSDRTSFLQARRAAPGATSTEPAGLSERFYRVHVITRPGYPSVSPAADEKVVSGDSLPAFVRNLALNECILALMWDHRIEAPGEFPSSWRDRLRQLRKIRERYAKVETSGE